MPGNEAASKQHLNYKIKNREVNILQGDRKKYMDTNADKGAAKIGDTKRTHFK